MKNNYFKVALLSVMALGASVWFAAASFADSTGHGKGVGSPDEVTCSQSGCHGAGGGNGVPGVADNAGGGSIGISCTTAPLMTGWVYTPGVTYHMKVTITQASGTIFGFSAVCLDEGLAQVGSITITDNVHTHTAGSFPINKQYVTHTGLASPAPGTSTNTSPAIFSFDWVAPLTNKGNLTFYFDGIAGNNNQLEDGGDNVYKGSQVITPNTPLSTPTIFSSLTGFFLRTTAGTAGPGEPFFVGGQALTGNITVAVPSPMEVSTSPSGPWSGSLSLTQMSGTVTGTKVWVRYNAALAGSATQTVTISSSGAASKTATMTGQVGTPLLSTPSPTVIPTFTTTVGTPSVVDSFTITSSGLIDTLKMSASANFEISHTKTRSFESSDWSRAFPPIWGFSNMKIYVRYNPAVAGSHTGQITVSSTGTASKTVNVSGISTTTSIPLFDLQEKDMKVFPNPAKDQTRLAFKLSETKNLEFRIIDLTGKLYFTAGRKIYQKGDNEIYFSTDALPAGLYFITTQDEGKTVHKSFVKE